MNETEIQLRAGALVVDLAAASSRLEPQYGPRFDRSAHITQVTWEDRPWLATGGMPDEFGLWGHGVLGFADEAPRDVADQFVKVGVGRLQKSQPGPFKPFVHWPIAELAQVALIEQATDRVTVEQVQPGDVWSYRQRKTYRLSENGELVIQYALANLGSQPIPVEHYSHNFFVITPTQGVRISAAFPMPLPPHDRPWRASEAGVELDQSRLVGPQAAWSWEPKAPAELNRVDLHWSDGASVRVAGDFPVYQMALWAKDDMVCPEVFFRTEIAPGQSATWQRSYHFGPIALSG